MDWPYSLVASIWHGIQWVAMGVWHFRFQIVGAVAAAVAIFAIGLVLRRLDRGAREPVGRWMTWLAVSLVVTLVCIDNISILHHAEYSTRVGYSYGAVALVLMSGGVGWFSSRRGSLRDTPELGNPRDSLLLLQASALLIALLWLIQRAFEKYQPNLDDPSVLATTFVVAGLLAMAAVQGLRTLLPLRGVFHRLTLERWVDDATRDDPGTSSPGEAPKQTEGRGPDQSAGTADAPVGSDVIVGRQVPEGDKPAGKNVAPAGSKDPRQILDTVIRLSRGPVAGDRYSLLDLPIEQLCGQIAAGADRLLDEPVAETLRTKGSAKIPAGVKEVLVALAAGNQDVDAYIAVAEGLRKRQASLVEATPESREYARLRANLSQRIQRNIDGLQITTTFWWRRVLRGMAFTICGVLGLSAFRGDPTTSLVCAVVGGFVSTASRDLVAVIEKLRR
jgi:hypothetical protein